MKLYTKPTIISNNSTNGLFPAMLGPVTFGIKAILAAGALAAALVSKKGNIVIDSAHTSTLTERKNFSLA